MCFVDVFDYFFELGVEYFCYVVLVGDKGFVLIVGFVV